MADSKITDLDYQALDPAMEFVVNDVTNGNVDKKTTISGDLSGINSITGSANSNVVFFAGAAADDTSGKDAVMLASDGGSTADGQGFDGGNGVLIGGSGSPAAGAGDNNGGAGGNAALNPGYGGNPTGAGDPGANGQVTVNGTPVFDSSGGLTNAAVVNGFSGGQLYGSAFSQIQDDIFDNTFLMGCNSDGGNNGFFDLADIKALLFEADRKLDSTDNPQTLGFNWLSFKTISFTTDGLAAMNEVALINPGIDGIGVRINFYMSNQGNPVDTVQFDVGNIFNTDGSALTSITLTTPDTDWVLLEAYDDVSWRVARAFSGVVSPEI